MTQVDMNMENLCEKLARLSADAIRLYERISGTAGAPELFVQSLTIANLCLEDDRFGARIEVNNRDFREDIGPGEGQTYYVQQELKQHRLDALLWYEGRLSGIVEFKRHTDIAADIERMACLMATCSEFTLGYVISFSFVAEDRQIDDHIALVRQVVAQCGPCWDPVFVGERFTTDEGEGRCCVCVIPVHPNKLPMPHNGDPAKRPAGLPA